MPAVPGVAQPLLAAALSVGSAAPGSPRMIFLALAILYAAIAAILDWRTRRIPNWLTYGATAVAVPLHGVFAWIGHGTPREIAMASGLSLLGAVLCGVLPAVFWLRGVCGGGDVKLLAALGALLEPFMGFEAQLYSYYLAAFFVPIALIYKGTFFRMLKNAFVMASNGLRPKSRQVELDPDSLTWFRLGPAVLGGCLLTAIVHLWQ
jgi:prepilin peptidase CpaA